MHDEHRLLTAPGPRSVFEISFVSILHAAIFSSELGRTPPPKAMTMLGRSLEDRMQQCGKKLTHQSVVPPLKAFGLSLGGAKGLELHHLKW